MMRRTLVLLLILMGLVAVARGQVRAAGLINDWSHQGWVVRFRAVTGGVVRGVVIDTPGGKLSAQFGRTIFEVKPVRAGLFKGRRFEPGPGGVKSVPVSMSVSGDVLVVQQQGQPQPLVFRQLKTAAAPGGSTPARPAVKAGTDLIGFWTGLNPSTLQNYRLTLKKDKTYQLTISGGRGGLPFTVWGKYQVQGNQLVLTHTGSRPVYPHLRFPAREAWRFKWLGPNKIQTPTLTLTRWR
jgi:hypothetical protein